MKTKHDGDCTFYSALVNGNPNDGICTCGYAHQNICDYKNYYSLMYSKERLKIMEKANKDHETYKNIIDNVLHCTNAECQCDKRREAKS